MVRVAHIANLDGALRYLLLNQLKSLAAEGYEVVGISPAGPAVSVLEAEGIRHLPVQMSRRFTPVRDLKTVFDLSRLIRREGFDIVHTHNPKPGLLGQLAAKLAGVPVIVNTLHGFYFHDHSPPLTRRFYVAMEKLAALCSDVILSQSREDVETAIREGIAPVRKLRHLGNGIDIRRFNAMRVDHAGLADLRSEFQIPPDAQVIGFVGRLVREKGLLELLDAAKLLRERGMKAHVLVVGPVDAEKADAITPQAAVEMGVADTCHFVGRRNDVDRLYGLMDVFVLPSYREGFPRVAMEASAMGVPCVVTDVRGCREAVEHERNGLLVPVRDASALANAIGRVLTDTDLAGRMGREGRQVALERFDEEQVFEIVKQEYARLLEQKGLRVPGRFGVALESANTTSQTMP